ncbi:hypothetical protein B0T09DRAFT_22671 [Sordaria sp. MPI-SDFR-AT-0083]|nr:hypothetical protein B0T09DRAFT_22671 [Sordaria sp. MPI-SDFR-AT-0083]
MGMRIFLLTFSIDYVIPAIPSARSRLVECNVDKETNVQRFMMMLWGLPSAYPTLFLPSLYIGFKIGHRPDNDIMIPDGGYVISNSTPARLPLSFPSQFSLRSMVRCR